jgi:type II secretory pathway component PulF
MSLLSTNELIGFCRRVGTMLKSGVEVRRVFEQEGGRGSQRYRTAMQAILDRVKQGESVAIGAKEADVFPPVALAMMEIGEHTGKLDAALFRLAEHYENQVSLQRQFAISIIWPALQLTAAVVIIGALIWILGAIGGTQLDGKPFDVTGLGLSGASGALIWFLAIGVIATGLGALIHALLNGWFGPRPVRLAMHVPIIGPCLRYSAMSRLTWALGMALDSGMEARRSVELSIQATQNPFFLSRTESAVAVIAGNREFYEAFRDAGGFPDDFLQELETAEIAGTLSESLVRMSHNYDEKAKTALQAFTWACTIAVWLLMAVIMIALIFRLAIMFIIKPLNDAIEMTQPRRT